MTGALMTEQETPKPATDMKTLVTTAVAVKIAGIIGAAILLILQTLLVKEGATIEGHASQMVDYERLMQQEIKEIRDMVQTMKK